MNKITHGSRAAEITMETLREQFKPFLGLSKARLDCFLMLVLAVISQRTVSLVWLARHPLSAAKPESVHRRFQRFFADCPLPARRVGALVLALAPKPADGWVLAMDRTNWKFGRTHINILVVTAILGEVGLPIAWRVLPKSTKRGNSRTNHRIALMREVLGILPVEDIRALTMDREFVGERWLWWLGIMEVPYVARVKSDTAVDGRPASWWSWRNRWKRSGSERHEVFGLRVHFAAKRIARGRDTHVAVVSNIFQGGEALGIYRIRWGIETLFSHLKKRGFRFEDTRMTKGERVGKLMGVLAVAFALSYQWGRKLEEDSGLKLKKHGYRARSVFRQGLESLHHLFQLPLRLAERLADFLDHVVRIPLACQNVV